MLVGIASDQRIIKVELSAIQAWMEAYERLKTCWPDDELEALLVHVLKDGVIPSAEHAALMRYFAGFSWTEHRKAIELESELRDAAFSWLRTGGALSH